MSQIAMQPLMDEWTEHLAPQDNDHRVGAQHIGWVRKSNTMRGREPPHKVESRKKNGARERNRLRSAEVRILQLVISRCKCDCLANEKPPKHMGRE